MFFLRHVLEAGGCNPTLCEAMHHGCEAGPAKLQSVCLAGETRTADQKIPSDGGDRLPGPWHEGEFDLLSKILIEVVFKEINN